MTADGRQGTSNFVKAATVADEKEDGRKAARLKVEESGSSSSGGAKKQGENIDVGEANGRHHASRGVRFLIETYTPPYRQ